MRKDRPEEAGWGADRRLVLVEAAQGRLAVRQLGKGKERGKERRRMTAQWKEEDVESIFDGGWRETASQPARLRWRAVAA